MDTPTLQRNLLARVGRLRRHIRTKLPLGLRSVIAVDDVLQEAFAVAFRQTKNFELQGLDCFDAWITMVVNQCVADTVKRYRRLKRGSRFGHVRGNLNESSCLDLFNQLGFSTATPSSEVAVREAVSCLRSAIAALPDEQRHVIELRHFEGQSYVDIALAMRKTVPAVRGLLQRAVQTLRSDLGQASRFFSDATLAETDLASVEANP